MSDGLCSEVHTNCLCLAQIHIQQKTQIFDACRFCHTIAHCVQEYCNVVVWSLTRGCVDVREGREGVLYMTDQGGCVVVRDEKRGCVVLLL